MTSAYYDFFGDLADTARDPLSISGSGQSSIADAAATTDAFDEAAEPVGRDAATGPIARGQDATVTGLATPPGGARGLVEEGDLLFGSAMRGGLDTYAQDFHDLGLDLGRLIDGAAGTDGSEPGAAGAGPGMIDPGVRVADPGSTMAESLVDAGGGPTAALQAVEEASAELDASHEARATAQQTTREALEAFEAAHGTDYVHIAYMQRSVENPPPGAAGTAELHRQQYEEMWQSEEFAAVQAAQQQLDAADQASREAYSEWHDAVETLQGGSLLPTEEEANALLPGAGPTTVTVEQDPEGTAVEVDTSPAWDQIVVTAATLRGIRSQLDEVEAQRATHAVTSEGEEGEEGVGEQLTGTGADQHWVAAWASKLRQDLEETEATWDYLVETAPRIGVDVPDDPFDPSAFHDAPDEPLAQGIQPDLDPGFESMLLAQEAAPPGDGGDGHNGEGGIGIAVGGAGQDADDTPGGGIGIAVGGAHRVVESAQLREEQAQLRAERLGYTGNDSADEPAAPLAEARVEPVEDQVGQRLSPLLRRAEQLDRQGERYQVLAERAPSPMAEQYASRAERSFAQAQSLQERAAQATEEATDAVGMNEGELGFEEIKSDVELDVEDTRTGDLDSKLEDSPVERLSAAGQTQLTRLQEMQEQTQRAQEERLEDLDDRLVEARATIATSGDAHADDGSAGAMALQMLRDGPLREREEQLEQVRELRAREPEDDEALADLCRTLVEGQATGHAAVVATAAVRDDAVREAVSGDAEGDAGRGAPEVLLETVATEARVAATSATEARFFVEEAARTRLAAIDAEAEGDLQTAATLHRAADGLAFARDRALASTMAADRSATETADVTTRLADARPELLPREVVETVSDAAGVTGAIAVDAETVAAEVDADELAVGLEVALEVDDPALLDVIDPGDGLIQPQDDLIQPQDDAIEPGDDFAPSRDDIDDDFGTGAGPPTETPSTSEPVTAPADERDAGFAPEPGPELAPAEPAGVPESSDADEHIVRIDEPEAEPQPVSAGDVPRAPELDEPDGPVAEE